MPIFYATVPEPFIKQEYIIKAGFRMVDRQEQLQHADQSGSIRLYDDASTVNIEKITKKQRSSPNNYNNEIAHGFGKDVPFAFAIRQIVPRQIKIVYVGDIDKDEKVNWIGERPWGQIVRELAFYRNIQVSIDSSTVILVKHPEKRK